MRPWISGLGLYDDSPFSGLGQASSTQAELERIRAERVKVEAEIAKLRGAVAPVVSPTKAPAGKVAPAPGFVSGRPSWLVPVAIVGGLALLFMFGKKKRKRRS